MLEGRVPACPPLGICFVDVRDIADLRAMPDLAAGERFLWPARALGVVHPEMRLLGHRLGRDVAAMSAKA
ncbi:MULTISPECIES: hypothetical protein [unclassified Streptomyces]|uniref:hypothetical protein n=1 Tax=unclassified Streptomyces TaxID=2593676 RepID=UPI00331A9863